MSAPRTIAAVSTAPGAGAVGMVRLSGPESRAVLEKVFRPRDAGGWEPRRLRLGLVTDPVDGTALDEALAVWFPAPRSFTGEEVCEIQGHGGPAVGALTLEALLKAGAVLAEPGEFTRRAFMNGRLDLAQAEAVADLVAARSAAEAALAAGQLAGALSERIESLRRPLMAAAAELEAAIDFGDEMEPLDLDDFRRRLLAEVIAPTEALLAEAGRGRPFREGLKLALAGAPNVGKSSLFNALVGSDRALVTARPGTTRDFITAEAVWRGLRVELADTAGLSPEPVDELDALGQSRSLEQAGRADVALLVRDATRPEAVPPDWSGSPERTLTVWNKADLASPPAGPGELAVSALTGQGLGELREAVLRLAAGGPHPRPPEVVPNLRHRLALERALAHLRAAAEAAEAGLPADICALELRDGLKALEMIVGRVTADDILREIFSRFCLGK